MYRGSSLTEFCLPEEAEEFDLEDVACPACPVALGRSLWRQNGYVAYVVSLYLL